MAVVAIVRRTRELQGHAEIITWKDILDLQAGEISDELALPAEISQICPFLVENLPKEMKSLVESTTFPVLSRHLTNSFGIWELPISTESENLGSAIYPSASYFNHSCDPNVSKLRQGRTVHFIASRDILCGEEVCISYGQLGYGVEERRRTLRKWWGFHCDCNRCKQELL